MSTTRERKLKFLKDGGLSLREGVTEMLAVRGDDWLTDEQIADLVRFLIDIQKDMQRRNRKNREFYRTHSIMDLDQAS
ncbi:MAG TPA: hypothetical protein VFU31_29755 [Candidatus Binatia bacterium]|nr:hypothetical protein [Candidatus Binatia bacterium]